MSNEHDAEADIRALIESWANAVQRQDIETIVARHATNFLMFDVPPPNELRGIDAYRDSWVPFFDHFKDGGVFAIERLDVTAGDRVAFATALLGEAEAPHPSGRWPDPLARTACLQRVVTNL